MNQSAKCAGCGQIFGLDGRGNRTVYCDVACRERAKNRRAYKAHRGEIRARDKASKRRSLNRRRPMHYVDTACLPLGNPWERP